MKSGGANDMEKWIIVSDLLDEISIHLDHVEVEVARAPRHNAHSRT